MDWIGDIGGLLEAMFVIFSLLIALYHYKAFEIHMIGQLFSLTQDKDNQEKMNKNSTQKISQIRLFIRNTVLFFRKKISETKMGEDTQVRAYRKAKKNLYKDLNIIDQVRLYREHRLLVKMLLNNQE